jgi:hypothetical protein
VRAGWVLAGRSELLPEAEGEAQPAYEVLALAELPDCREYRLLLDAGSGKLLHLHERACGPGR